MSKEYPLTVSVFSSESTTECLDSYKSHGNIYEIEDDLLDGEDWWYEYANYAEGKYGSKWSTILIKTEDELKGRFIDRNYFLDGIINNNNFLYHDKIFLIGESSFVNLNAFFSGHIIFNYQLSNIKSVKYYQKGYDETLIALIKSFIIPTLVDAKVVDVIYNPSPQAIMMMKLADHYQFMVHIPSKDKVNEFIGLSKSLEFTSSIYHEILQARRIANGYGTSELNFMLPLIEDIETKIDPKSDDSFYKTFERKFCL